MRERAGETKTKKEMILRDHTLPMPFEAGAGEPVAAAALLETPSGLDILKRCQLDRNWSHQRFCCSPECSFPAAATATARARSRKFPSSLSGLLIALQRPMWDILQEAS